MLDVFKRMVAKQRPDYILGIHVVSYKQLYAATCKYAKGGNYFAATTFYTDTWIAGDPLGPIMSGICTPCKSLNDIANIFMFSSLKSCINFKSVCESDIESFVSTLKESAVGRVDNLVSNMSYGDSFKTELLLAPMPALVVTIMSSDALVGTILLLANGVVYPVFACDQRLFSYVEILRQHGSPTAVKYLNLSDHSEVGNNESGE